MKSSQGPKLSSVSKLFDAIYKGKAERLDVSPEGEETRSLDETEGAPTAVIVNHPARRGLEKRARSAKYAVRHTAPDVHNRPEEHMVSLIDPLCFEADQFRSLRHIMEQKQRTAGLRALAVTSANGGDGKSLVAVNLAGALAQSKDHRVLLIDADLRAPSIDGYVGLSGHTRGLIQAVAQSTPLEDAVVERPRYNLSILPVGGPCESPYEVLKSEQFAFMLEQAKSRFDFVVIDTPPLLACSDARLLEDKVDGFLMVVGAHKTPREMVDEALNTLPADKIIGLVFNGHEETAKYYSTTTYGKNTAKRRWWQR